MAEFYTWPEAARLAVTLLLALCVLSQCLAMILSFFVLKRRLRALLELFALALVLFCSLLHGQVVKSFETGLIAPVGYGPLRVSLTSRAAVWVFLGALLCLLARAVWISLRRTREIKTGISALSVKNAIDSLRTGILFSEPDGFVLLSNTQMQRLMTVISGGIQQSGWEFYTLLASGPLQPGCRRAATEGRIVCLLPDNSAWRFKREELRIGRKKYLLLTAADVTKRWEMTTQLQRQNDLLVQKSGELRETIATLHILSRDRETQKAKMRAHDILGQRLTVLLRMVRDEQALDYGLLRSLSRGLLDELVSGAAPSAQDALDGLRQGFGVIGVNILVEGTLPGDSERAQLFVDAIREGATNAVRHGFATEIFVRMDETRLRIDDNGLPPPGIIMEGEGLGGLRKKTEACGGALRVVTQPRFILELDLPGGDSDV